MKANQIKVGGVYTAKVNGIVRSVRVDRIEEGFKGRPRYHVTNLATGRKTVFRSAAKFRSEVKPRAKVEDVPPRYSTLQPGHAVDKVYDENGKKRSEAELRAAGITGSPYSEEASEETDPFARSAAVLGPAPSDVERTARLEQEVGQVYDEGTEQWVDAPTGTSKRTSSLAAAAAPAAEPTVRRVELPDPQPFLDALVGREVRFTANNLSGPGEDTLSKLNAPTGLAAQLAKRQAANGKTAPHGEGKALAGTGKTTTAVEGIGNVKGIGTTITPSPEQEAIWAWMAAEKPESVRMVAYNTSIADEVKARFARTGLDKRGCEGKTTHGMGFSAVLKAFPQLRNKKVNGNRTKDILAEMLGKDRFALQKEEPVLVGCVEELTSLCKQTLTEPTEEGLIGLASHHDVDLADKRQRVFELVPQVLELSADPERGGMIDFDDMVWFPLRHRLPIWRSDLLIVDESQDLNKARQELCKLAGHRILYIGDEHQAIYGFAGADAESMANMRTALTATERGCSVMPLTVTRRCGKAIVEEARAIVPEFAAHESNPEGVISDARWPIQGQGERRRELPWEQTYCALAKPGDMLLCRVNAPLVGQCFRFLKRGIKATIQGRNISDGIIALVKRLRAGNVADLIAKLTAWHERETAAENARKNHSEQKLISLQDKLDCLLCFCEDAATTDEVISRIDRVFTNDPHVPGIKLSSIHKSKGLEADHVFLLEPEGATVPHPLARKPWQRQQEMNLRYVAITRAIRELTYVS